MYLCPAVCVPSLLARDYTKGTQRNKKHQPDTRAYSWARLYLPSSNTKIPLDVMDQTEIPTGWEVLEFLSSAKAILARYGWCSGVSLITGFVKG